MPPASAVAVPMGSQALRDVSKGSEAGPVSLLLAIGLRPARAVAALDAMQPYDFACLGLAERSGDGLRIDDAALLAGELLQQKTQLQQRLALLVAAWTTMESAIVLDLGSCACIGTRLTGSVVPRLFAVDALALDDKRLLFISVSSTAWRLESVPKHVLRSALEEAMQGGSTEWTLQALRVLHQPALARKAGKIAAAATAMLSLSPRQMDIVRLIGAGCTNKEIAQRLGLSPFTVRNQISLMSAKTGHRRRSQLTAMLYRLSGQAVDEPNV
jgi:DNA-binding CsgD family transcriptional regulator